MLDKLFYQAALKRADHHAKPVYDVISVAAGNLQLIGAKITSHRSNIVWFELGSNKYVIAYNHDKKKIEIRSRNQQGNCLFDFDSSTPLQNINDLFYSL